LLIEILREIQRLSTFSVAKLARSLNKDEALIEHMISRLEAMGYLKEVVMNNSCGGNCNSCGMICPTRPIKAMTITEKGNALLKANTVAFQ